VDDTLTAAQVTELLEEIVGERVRAVAQIEALTRDFDEIVEASALEPPDDEHDPDGVTIAWEREQIAALLTHEREQLVALDRAAEQLRTGTFGRCSRCGGPIGFERLMARPSTATCIACAT
jgi:DnaK suppressor protein